MLSVTFVLLVKLLLNERRGDLGRVEMSPAAVAVPNINSLEEACKLPHFEPTRRQCELPRCFHLMPLINKKHCCCFGRTFQMWNLSSHGSFCPHCENMPLPSLQKINEIKLGQRNKIIMTYYLCARNCTNSCEKHYYNTSSLFPCETKCISHRCKKGGSLRKDPLLSNSFLEFKPANAQKLMFSGITLHNLQFTQ